MKVLLKRERERERESKRDRKAKPKPTLVREASERVRLTIQIVPCALPYDLIRRVAQYFR